LPVLLENWEYLSWIGNRAARSGSLQLFKKYVNAARDHGRERAAGGGTNILEGMPAAAWRKHRGARPGIDLLPFHFELVLAVDDIPPFILIAVAM